MRGEKEREGEKGRERKGGREREGEKGRERKAVERKALESKGGKGGKEEERKEGKGKGKGKWKGSFSTPKLKTETPPMIHMIYHTKQLS